MSVDGRLLQPLEDFEICRLVKDRSEETLDELAGRLVYGECWTPKLKRELRNTRRQAGTPRELFARLNATLPPWERYKKIGEVSLPVPADIYRAPLESDPSGND